MIELGLIAFALLTDPPQDQLVFIPIEVEQPSQTPMEQRNSELALYGARCLANDLANRAFRNSEGAGPVDPYVGVRALAAELAVESTTWGYAQISYAMVDRAQELMPAIAYLLPILDAGQEPTDEAMIANLRQVQADCQDEIRARLQIRALTEQQALGGLADVASLQRCAALYLEEALHLGATASDRQSARLRDLAMLHMESHRDVDDEIARLRAVFSSQFFATEVRPDGSYSDLLAQNMASCGRMVADLEAADILPAPAP